MQKGVVIMDKQSLYSTVTGAIVGMYDLFISQQFTESILKAFCTGAAAWIGQTIVKEIYQYFKNKHNDTQSS